MIIYRGDPLAWEPPAAGAAVAIGVFDGVHLGHRRVLGALRDGDDHLVRVAVTFGTHPAALLAPEGAPPRLSTLKRRLDLLAEAGIERVAVLEFDDHLRTLSPEQFVERFLVAGLRAQCVAVGAGFRFGVDAKGTTSTLEELGGRFGFCVKVVDIRCDDGTEIRSTAIREAIAAGDMARAAALLGRPYELEGIVVPGDGRGRELGTPTANVSFPAMLAVPLHGVYAVTVTIDGIDHEAVANLGVRPTFGEAAEVLEVHVLGLDRNLYGKQVTVAFVERIREERKFDGIEALKARIREDVAAAQRVFADRVS